jgi:hypothetical protein
MQFSTYRAHTDRQAGEAGDVKCAWLRDGR